MVSSSTRLEVAWYSRAASGLMQSTILPDAARLYQATSKRVDEETTASTRLEVAWYSRAASGRIVDCISPDASDRYDEPMVQLLGRINAELAVYTGLIETARTNNRQGNPVGSSVSPLEARVTATAASVMACS
ncbi:hypothetical protein JHV675_52900 [Mycobacterium avium subsp. hominissuis]